MTAHLELDFWSRRRAAVEAEAKEETRRQEVREEERRVEELETKGDEEILSELGLPDPDSLEKGDDFSRFMARAVPERIRRRALRKLWLSNPVLANLDELVDYGEDFTDAATVVENLQTAYQVGKGMLEHVMALESESEKEDISDADADDSQAEEVVASEPSPVKLPESHGVTAYRQEETDATPDTAEEEVRGQECQAESAYHEVPPVVVRRMQFRVVEA